MASGKKTGAKDTPETQTPKDGAAKSTPATPAKSGSKTSAKKPVIAETTGGSSKKTEASISSAGAAASKKSAPAQPDAKGESPADKGDTKTTASSSAATAKNVAAVKPLAEPGKANQSEAEQRETEKDPASKDDKSAFQPTRDVISSTTGAGSAAAPAPSEPVEKRSGSVFWPFVLGGVVAAALGFAASEANLLGFRADGSEVRVELERQADDISALQDAAPPEADLSGVEQEIARLSEAVQSFEDRIVALEDRPVASSGDGGDASAYAAEFEQMQASLQQQRSEIEGLLANAQSIEEATAEAARAAAIQAGVSKVTAAISTGSAYDGALNDLREAGVDDLPQPLVDGAADGVATLGNLQGRFPDAARDALAAARASGQDGVENGGVTAFLRRQLGARSVQPREGSDPDAVLSRAEAAVRDGRLSVALNEIDTLPGEAQSAMSDWIADARARAAAEAAVNDLSQSLTAN